MSKIRFYVISQDNKIFIKVTQNTDTRVTRSIVDNFPKNIQEFFLKRSKKYYSKLLTSHKEKERGYDKNIALSKRFPNILQSMYCGVNKDLISKFCIGAHTDSHPSSCSTFLFELPTIPHIALLQLGYISFTFNVFLTQNSYIRESLFTTNLHIDDASSDSCSEEIENFKALLNKILILIDEQKNYQATKKAILSIKQDYNDIPFISLLNAKNLDEKLYKKVGYLALDPATPLSLRIANLLTKLQCYIHNNQFQEATFFINNINLMTKEALFSKCLSKEGYMLGWNSETEGDEIYGWDSREWDFLMKSRFCVREDGRVQIIISNDDSINHFSSFNFKHAIKSFFLKLNLEISHDAQFNKEIIFSSTSSAILKNALIHADLHYFMELIKHKNNCFSLFRQAHKHYDDHQTNFNNIPLEVIDKIASLSATNLDIADAQATFTYVLNNRV